MKQDQEFTPHRLARVTRAIVAGPQGHRSSSSPSSSPTASPGGSSARVDGVGATAASATAAASATSQVGTLLLVHRVLRGRYKLATILALLGAACGGALGWTKLGKRQYRSESLIRIAYDRKPVEVATDQNGPMAAYEIFMQSQQTLMSSHRVVNKALQHPEWQATGRGASPMVVKAFADNLTIEFKSRTEFLRAYFTDEDPAVATAAVKAVVEAYKEVYEAEQSDRARIKLLEDRRKDSADALAKVDAELAKYVETYGTTNLDEVFEQAQQAALQLKTTLGGIEVELAMGGSEGRGTATQAAPPVGSTGRPNWVNVLTPERIAMIDAPMRSYLDEQRRAESNLARLKERGYGDGSAAVVDAQGSVEKAREAVQQHAEDYRDFLALTGQNPFARPGAPTDAVGSLLTNKPRELLLAEQRTIGDLARRAQERVVSLGKDRQALQELVARANATREQISKRAARADALQTESLLGDRLTVLSSGDTPLVPFRDTRLRMAAVGVVGGAAVPLGLLVALGLVRQRFRYSDDAKAMLAARVPLLGIVPSLSSATGEAAGGAAQCVHQMRVMLQVGQSNGGGCRSYLVTSAAAGDGKTSLATALGLSFAASGSRTLLVDCDLVGQRLTRNMTGQGTTGLAEALEGGSLRGHVRKMAAGLCVMTVGGAGASDACGVSSEGMKRLLAEGERCFDVILFDSGPILGSVEASVLAQIVDGVVFTIARGREQYLVDKAMHHLDSLKASVSGVVFNRAEVGDFYRSGYTSSISSGGGAMGGAGANEQLLQLQRRSRMGLLVEAVMLSLPSGRIGAATPVPASPRHARAEASGG